MRCIYIIRENKINLSPNGKLESVSKSILDSNEENYERPGKIINQHLAALTKSGDFKLNECLWESYDYILVNVEAWDYFKRWYGYDIEIIYNDEEE